MTRLCRCLLTAKRLNSKAQGQRRSRATLGCELFIATRMTFPRNLNNTVNFLAGGHVYLYVARV